MSVVNVLLGILIGLTIGGVLGIIISPDNGVITRKKISIDKNNHADGLKNKVDATIVTALSDPEYIKIETDAGLTKEMRMPDKLTKKSVL